MDNAFLLTRGPAQAFNPASGKAQSIGGCHQSSRLLYGFSTARYQRNGYSIKFESMNKNGATLVPIGIQFSRFVDAWPAWKWTA
jgi:hypothetical protein